MTTAYDQQFFDQMRQGSDDSASHMAPIVLDLVPAASVIDVGCGEGVWLAAFERSGVKDFLGVDGDYVSRDSLKIPRERFLARDLRQPFAVDRTFDLAVCLEVAEHLPPESAATFVACLCKTAPAVLFSAAAPAQGGVDHLNEQWPTYWARHFAEQGFTCFDAVRPRIWANQGIKWWYRQNALLFVRRSVIDSHPRLRTLPHSDKPMDLVHPENWQATVQHMRWLEGRRGLREKALGFMKRIARPGPARGAAKEQSRQS